MKKICYALCCLLLAFSAAMLISCGDSSKKVSDKERKPFITTSPSTSKPAKEYKSTEEMMEDYEYDPYDATRPVGAKVKKPDIQFVENQ